MKQTLCCLNMYSNRIDLKVNDFADGFTDLLWYKEDSDQIYKVSLPKNRIIVGGLSEGYYSFYTRNPDTMLETVPMTFFFKSELPSYIINRLWSSADIEAITYTNNLKLKLLLSLEKTPSASLLQLLYNEYCSISDLEEFEEDIFYRLIICQETYENLQISNYNRDGAGFARLVITPSPVITVPYDVDIVKVYQIINGNKRLYDIHRVDDRTLTIPLMQGLFEMHLVQDSCLFSILRHCNLSERCMIKLWGDYQNSNMEYLDVIENNLSSSMDFKDFTAEEETMHKEEIGMTPMNAVIPRIQVTEEQYLRSVNLLISGVSFASVSQHNFFVSGRDADFLSENVQNEFIPLIANTDSFTSSFEPANCMLDKEALLYVVDEQGTTVSRITRCLLDENSTTSLADYYEKIRQAEINSYSRRLLSQVLSSYPEAWTYTQEMITRCLENSDVNIDNIMISLLSDISNAPFNIDKDLLSVEILKDFVASSKYNLNFFTDDGLIWKPTGHILTGEPSAEGYVICILAKFEGSNSYSIHYVHSFPDQAVDVLLNRYGSYAVYAISEVDYSYSGFVYINTTNGFLKSYLVNLEVK